MAEENTLEDQKNIDQSIIDADGLPIDNLFDNTDEIPASTESKRKRNIVTQLIIAFNAFRSNRLALIISGSIVVIVILISAVLSLRSNDQPDPATMSQITESPKFEPSIP